MGQFFRWLFIGLVLILVVSADALLVLKMEWPLWYFLIVLLAVIGVFLFFVLLGWMVRSLKQRRVMKKEEAQAGLSRVEHRESHSRVQQMQRQWKEVIKLLGKARLGKSGNPVTSFPWYLIIGGEKSGKTTAIKNSRLAVPFSDLVPGGHIAEGMGCAWWFLDDAIILDTPGRYTSQSNKVDSAEWRKCLHLIESTRKLAGINGLVVCIGADNLFSWGQDQLHQEGIKIRKRINEIMQIVGVRCPIYILVTKCDQIEGMVKFFQSFPEVSMNQAMGVVNEEILGTGHAESFVERGFNNVRQFLNQLRLVLLGSQHAADVQTQALLFPEEFTRLKSSLLGFVKPIFEETAYQEAPILRGIYFSSAHQEGRPFSSLMSKLGYDSERQTLSVSNMSYFLRDFFGKILVSDRRLAAPTHMALGLRRLGHNLGLTVWSVAGVLAGIILSLSFAKNLSVVRTTFDGLPPSVNLTKDFDQNLEVISKFRVAIQKLVMENDHWWIPRIGLNQSQFVQERLQSIYTGRFRNGILLPTDKNLEHALARVSTSTPPQIIAGNVVFMSNRIKLLTVAIAGDLDQQTWTEQEKPDFSWVLNEPVQEKLDTQAKSLLVDYDAYLEWQGDDRLLREELSNDKNRIKELLTREGIGLNWLTDWANMQEGLQPVSSKTYWGSEIRLNSGEVLKIDRAYTADGWKAIERFLSEIGEANQDDPVFDTKRQEFIANYRRTYFSEWQKFVLDFYQGFSAWHGREKRIELASRLASKDSPYTKLLADAPAGLQPAVELAQKPEQIPGWVQLIYRYESLNDQEYQKLLSGGKSVLGRLANKGGSVIRKLKAELATGSEAEEKTVARDQKALPYVKSYQETLKKVADTVQAPQAAFQLAKDVYVEAEVAVGEPQHSVSKNFWDQARLKENIGKGTPSEKVFWQLLSHQTEQEWNILLDEAGLYLQHQWENDVLAQGIGLTGWELIDALQGFNGKIWDFQNKSIAPFIHKVSGKGFQPKVLYKNSIEFTRGFLYLLNRGKVGKDAISGSYQIRISALPTDTNIGATIKPHESRLIVQCGSGNQELVNHNFPISKTITWSPQDCGEVTLEIYVGDIVLKKVYRGYKAFIQFLEDFRTGRRVFNQSNFPEQKGLLVGYRIRTITLGYTFSGHTHVLKLAQSDPSNVPEKIVEK